MAPGRRCEQGESWVPPPASGKCARGCGGGAIEPSLKPAGMMRKAMVRCPALGSLRTQNLGQVPFSQNKGSPPSSPAQTHWE